MNEHRDHKSSGLLGVHAGVTFYAPVKISPQLRDIQKGHAGLFVYTGTRGPFLGTLEKRIHLDPFPICSRESAMKS